MSTYVSIGRNIGTGVGGRLRAESWAAFRASVRESVETWAGPIVSDTAGVGEYDGAAEETAVIVGAGAPDRAARAQLRKELGWAAWAYSQESIALTFGAPTFVGPREP